MTIPAVVWEESEFFSAQREAARTLIQIWLGRAVSSIT